MNLKTSIYIHTYNIYIYIYYIYIYYIYIIYNIYIYIYIYIYICIYVYMYVHILAWRCAQFLLKFQWIFLYMLVQILSIKLFKYFCTFRQLSRILFYIMHKYFQTKIIGNQEIWLISKQLATLRIERKCNFQNKSLEIDLVS